jgi:CRP-like cAMP-binding protein
VPADPLRDLMDLDPALARGLIGVLTARLRERIEEGAGDPKSEAPAPASSGTPGDDGRSPGSSLESLFRLRQVPLFAGLAAEQLLVVADITKLVRYSPEQTVFVQGSAGRQLYVIVEGAVEVLAAGKKIAELKTNDCFGEMAVLDRTERSATVRAIAETTLMAMDREDFGDLLDLHPALARGVLTVLAQRVRASLE